MPMTASPASHRTIDGIWSREFVAQAGHVGLAVLRGGRAQLDDVDVLGADVRADRQAVDPLELPAAERGVGAQARAGEQRPLDPEVHAAGRRAVREQVQQRRGPGHRQPEAQHPSHAEARRVHDRAQRVVTNDFARRSPPSLPPLLKRCRGDDVISGAGGSNGSWSCPVVRFPPSSGPFVTSSMRRLCQCRRYCASPRGSFVTASDPQRIVMSTTAIAEHAFLSDRHSCALVDLSGSVDWLCFPRFDGPSVFGRLLDDDAGHWQLRPVGDARSKRRYVGRTLALQTTFTTAGGEVALTDALALGPDNGGHRLGRDVPHVLVRRLTCTSGAVEVEMTYRPRPEYGLIVPVLSRVDGGVSARGGADWLVLRHRSPYRSTPARHRRGSRSTPARPSPSRYSARLSSRPRRASGHSWSSPICSTTRSPRGSRGRSCISPTTGRGAIWSTTAAGSCTACPTSPAAPSSPPRPPRCRRASAASATGTTATPGCATRASRWRRCGSPPAPTRRATSSRS